MKPGEYLRSKQRYQELGWKVHVRAQSFILRLYTMYDKRGRIERACERGCQFNILTSVFHASVLLLAMNFVITLSKKLWIQEAIAEWIRRLL